MNIGGGHSGDRPTALMLRRGVIDGPMGSSEGPNVVRAPVRRTQFSRNPLAFDPRFRRASDFEQAESGGTYDNRVAVGYREARFSHLRAMLPEPTPTPHQAYVDYYPSAYQAGRRMMADGTFGSVIGHPLEYDRRLQMERAGGTAAFPPQAMGLIERRTSGYLDATTTVSQAIHKDRPYLTLRASTGALADVSVSAGMSGGATSNRRFFLGGGWTASFYLLDYDQISITVNDLSSNAHVEFTWTTNGLQASDRSLYYPQFIGTSDVGVGAYVPEGAYEVRVENDDANWRWTNPSIGSLDANYLFTGVYAPDSSQKASVTNVVAGAIYTPDALNSVVWILRPI